MARLCVGVAVFLSHTPCVTFPFLFLRTPCFTSKLQTKRGIHDSPHPLFSHLFTKTDSKVSGCYSPDIGGIEDARVLTRVTSQQSLLLERVGGASAHPIPPPDTHAATAESAAFAGTFATHPSHPSAQATNTPHSTHTIQPSDAHGSLMHASSSSPSSNTSSAAEATDCAVTQAKNAAV